MARKSRNNQRKTAGKFTTNPTQYLPLCNPTKYEHIYDRSRGFIIVRNIKEDRVVGTFDYPELREYYSFDASHLQEKVGNPFNKEIAERCGA